MTADETLTVLLATVESMRDEMHEGFAGVNDRLTPLEHYVTADKARNEAWASFKSGVAKVMTIVVSIIGVAVAAAGLVMTIVKALF